MNSRKTVLVAGGDLRYVYTARALAEQFDVHAAGFTRQIAPFPEITLTETAAEGLPACDVLVLPMPVSDDGVLVSAPFGRQNLPLKGLLAALRPDGIVLGGKFGKSAALFHEAGVETADYLAREELSTLNAVPTAEGALQILLEEMPCTIYKSRILVLGFGRIGSRLAQLLHMLGARVTVASRDVAELARAEMSGCDAMPLGELAERAGEFQVLCNTIPARIITSEILSRMHPDGLVLDLASKPGGVDLEAAQKCSRRVVWALSLPGKTAPVTAGEIIAKTIFHMLEERGVS
ncbi:MAG: dipicolinate synthase subunit A [Oscillospiraceae bacterium]|nr:dipicolinate synthase subunit A [Oscillospiraceae bacterium]MBQ9110968.1 dipicolinate synthase subunit A [Oscillospiraceae bacterium]